MTKLSDPAQRAAAGTAQVRRSTTSDTFHRRDDISPFWGGAGITQRGGTCSSGYAVRNGGRQPCSASPPVTASPTARTPGRIRPAQLRYGLLAAPADRHRAPDGHGAPRRQDVLRPGLHGRRREHDQPRRGRGRRGFTRLQRLLPQRPDHRRELRAHRHQHERPGVHVERLQVTGDRRSPAAPSSSPATPAARSTPRQRGQGLDPRQRDRHQRHHRLGPAVHHRVASQYGVSIVTG